MSKYFATIRWARQENESFIDNQYSRGHQWHFDGGITIAASSSPHVVPLPYSIATHVDPEEAFVAALSSCHMLFFLSLAAKNKWCVESYVDKAIGIMSKNDEGKIAMTQVVLAPKVIFWGEKQPSKDQIKETHHCAHELCFIANSVKTEVVIEMIF